MVRPVKQIFTDISQIEHRVPSAPPPVSRQKNSQPLATHNLTKALKERLEQELSGVSPATTGETTIEVRSWWFICWPSREAVVETH
jgi:hypothetical protein